jgi:hypothetical protein
MPRAEKATEASQQLAQLVTNKAAFPRQAAEDLQELLGHDLARPTPGERRQARLGLLIELLSDADDQPITTTLYDQARAEKKEQGQDWPDSSNLTRAYGHWLAAVRAATRFWLKGSKGNVPHLYPEQPSDYMPQEVINGLISFRREYGDWPTAWEWDEYLLVRREIARRAGTQLRLPSRRAMRKAYGGFAKAVEAAQAHYEDVT